jgi:hypothetical protein
MKDIEHHCLLLRQTAALRQQGLNQAQALALVVEGLPEGPLRDGVLRARKALSSGEPLPPTDDAFLVLLTRGDIAAVTLEHAAQALEARLWADTALRTTRLYLVVGLAVPLLLASLLAWLPYVRLLLPEALPVQSATSLLLVLARFLAPLLALLVILTNRRWFHAFMPGFHQLNKAARLLDPSMVAVLPSGPEACPPEVVAEGGSARAFYLTRRASVGPVQAARELGLELLRQGQGNLLLLRHLAPIAGALLIWPFFWGLAVGVVIPLFQNAQNAGFLE